MAVDIYQVDAFTDRPFHGNPAGVCILPEAAGEEWMQDVAAEMNLSETAFLVQTSNGFDLRWFTPQTEVDLCGHATLAGAHIIWQTGIAPETETLRFQTRSGLLSASRRGNWIELDFPAEPVSQVEAPRDLLEAFDVPLVYVGSNRMDYLVEVENPEDIRTMRPDLARLSKLNNRGVMVTSVSDDPEFDFISRFFAPAVGIPEDPVTGSAHCALAPYWSKRLGKDEMIAYQDSSRGGVVKVKLAGDRVLLSGQAVTVIRGEVANF